MDISIIIPAFNEEKKIGRDIVAAASFLEKLGMSGEILIVDDGSQDHTAQIANETTIHSAALHVIQNRNHQGKGYAVKTGILRSQGATVMFADTGCCIPYDNAIEALDMIRNKTCEIAIGSRKHPKSVIIQPQNIRRQILSAIFRMLSTTFLKTDKSLSDTQCGFKLYQGDLARNLFAQCRCKGFMFDVEILLRAKQNGCVIREFPVHWTCDPDSRLHIFKKGWQILSEMFKIKYHYFKNS